MRRRQRSGRDGGRLGFPRVRSLVRRWAAAFWEAWRIVLTRLVGRTPVLVLQPGKVGSTTLTRSMRASGVGSVFALHFLSEAGVREALEAHEHVSGARVPDHLVRSAVWRRALSTPLVRDVKAITLVRDPIARDVSDLFQNPELWGFTDGDLDAEQASRLMQTHFENFDEESDYFCRWFDRELQEALGVDPYSRPFDTDRGWQHVATGGIDLLIVRTEDVDAALREAVPGFVGRDDPVPVVRANVGDRKGYSEEYAKVRRTLRLDRDTCRRVYDSRLVRHFYSAEEIERMIARWADVETGMPS